MKKLFLMIFILNFNIANGGFIKKSEFDKCQGFTVYTKKSFCGNDCVEMPRKYNCNFVKLAPKMVDDEEKPIKVCEGLDAVLDFVGFDKNGCKITGYEQKDSGEQIIAIDETKKTAFESSKAASEADEKALKEALKRINYGKKVIALIIVRNSSKNLTTSQVKQMNATYSEIKGLLETGSLISAKEEIQGVTTDGTIVTNSDKNALVEFIEAY